MTRTSKKTPYSYYTSNPCTEVENCSIFADNTINLAPTINHSHEVAPTKNARNNHDLSSADGGVKPSEDCKSEQVIFDTR